MNWLADAGLGIATVGGAVGLMGYSCMAPQSQWLGPTVVRGPKGARRVALTFDDGPTEPYTSQILDILRQARIDAAFFACGKNVERLPDVARRIHAEGHVLANHTFTHPFLYLKRRMFIADEIDRTQATIERVTGQRPKLFRPPYGIRWFGLFHVLRERGMRCIQWSNASFDWVERNGPEDIVAHAIRRLSDGAILLLHDGREPKRPEEVNAAKTVAALPKIIESVKAAGLDFVTVDKFVA